MKERLEYVLAGRDELTKPLKRAEGQMKNLERQAKRTGVQMNQFGGALTGAGKDLRKFAMGGLQQAGYQIGDYAVQVANGTSKMQAFGQQAPQLLQIFGPLGAVAGAAVSIFAAYAVAAEKMEEASAGAGNKAKTLADKISHAASEVDSLQESMRMATVSGFRQMTKEFGGFTYGLSEMIGLMRELRQEEAVTALTDAFTKLETEGGIGKIRNELSGLEEEIRQITADQLKVQQDKTLELSEQKDLLDALQESYLETGSRIQENLANLGVTVTEANKLTSAVDAVNNAFASGDVEAVRDAVISMRELVASLPDPLRQKMLPDLIEIEIISRKLGVNFEGVASSIQTSTNKIEILLDRVRKSRDVIFDPRDPRYNKIAAMMAQINEENDKGAKKATKSVSDLAKKVKIELTPEMVRAQKLGQSIGQSFESAFMSAVDGTMSAKDAFRTMAADIIKELYRVFVVKKITGFISDFVGMAALPSGGTYTGTEGLPSFNGGGYTGNRARSGGMDGKGGFMAMLHPRETVVDHTKGQGGGVTVVQNINVSTGVQQTVRTEIKSLMPQIAESAKAAVADAKRRGGSYGRAFA